MKDFKDWSIGDIVVCRSNLEGQYVKGREYKITAINKDPMFEHISTIDMDGNANGWTMHQFYFVREDVPNVWSGSINV